MKKIRVVSKTVVLMIVMGFVVNDGHAQERGQERGQRGRRAALRRREERTVVIWGPTDAVIYQRAQAVLDKQYPGIKIEHFESIPEPLVQRIIAESQAGKPAGRYHSVRFAARVATFDRPRHAGCLSGVGKGFWP